MKVETKPLPHRVGNASIASPELKTVVMQFMENFNSLHTQVSALQHAVSDIKQSLATGRVGTKKVRESVEDLDEDLAEKWESLADVATSGSYSDLSNTPTLAAVATSGSYSDLSDTPTLAAVATSGDYDDLIDKPNLATVATSGSYNDLTDQPTIPDISNCVTREYFEISDTPLVTVTEWAANTAYEVGAVVTHGGELYVCKSAQGSTVSSFSTTYWEAVVAVSDSNVNHFAGEIVINDGKYYRCKSAYYGTWGDGSKWEEVLVEKSLGLVDRRIKMRLVNSIAVYLPALALETYSDLKFPMSGLVDDASRSYYVTATFCNVYGSSVTGKITSSSDSTGKSVTVAASGGTATTDALAVPGTGWVKISQGGTALNGVIIKVYALTT